MTEEINYFVCGYCAWAQMMDTPEDAKEKYPYRRGYCRFNPPAVFPVPSQSQQKIAALGQAPPVNLAPFMLRPVVEENEPMCGQYAPNEEAVKGLGLKQEGGCDTQDCEREGCRCGN